MSRRKYFGTDGIRGHYGSAHMNPGFARGVGAALARWLKGQGEAGRVLIGRDTRASGGDLLEALAEGLGSEGLEALDAGVAPTPAIAMGIQAAGAIAGVAITASHNPAQDNGIKIFNKDALKLADATELEIEGMVDKVLSSPPDFPDAAPRPFDALAVYLSRLGRLLPAGALDGWTIAVDCAHGATARTTPQVLRGLGATIYAIGDAPDGTNINSGLGSEHPDKLRALVRETGARIGIAHDGDGDRVLLVDETGEVVHGDEILAMVGLHLLRTGELAQSTVVATIMSNLGLDEAVERAGGHVVRVQVGDRYVLEAMEANGYNFGGETSGHLIFREVSTTGDGLLAALQVLRLMRDTGEPLSRLRRALTRYPQLLKNLKVKEKVPLEDIPNFRERVREIEEGLERGRVLVRYSGTEPKIRILAEARTQEAAEHALADLEILVREQLVVL